MGGLGEGGMLRPDEPGMPPGLSMHGVSCTLDLAAPGKSTGYIRVARSGNQRAWSSLCVPIVAVNSPGSARVLVIGGVHGDEPEGVIAALNLARRIEPRAVRGRLIIVPCVSLGAATENQRLWTTGEDFNRCFGQRVPTNIPERLAAYFENELFGLVDTVIDLHSGGRSMVCLPWSEMHWVRDESQRRRMLDAMLVWNLPYHFIYTEGLGDGLLVTEAERQGKLVISTELGGGGHVTAAMHAVAAAGLENVLRHVGVLDGPARSGGELTGVAPVILRAVTDDNYLLAEEQGYFEPTVELGQSVVPGQEVGRIHSLTQPGRAPTSIEVRTEGVLCAIRALAACLPGDVVAVVGDVVVDESDLAEAP